MNNNKTFYTVLGIDQTANPARIKKAYYCLARTQHPDKVKNAEQTNAMKKISGY